MLLFAQALAAEAAPVLVSGLEPATPEASGLATLLEGYLAAALANDASITIRRVEDAPPFADYDARTYMDACPRGDAVGCTFVLGDRADARYAVTGSVTPLPDGARLRVSILDIEDARVVVTFRHDVPVGGDAAFADAVAKVVHAVVAGEIGAPDDIRDEGTPEEGVEGAVERADNAVLAAQLAELAPELSAAADVLSDPRESIRPPKFTVGDLATMSEAEGAHPWERVGLRPGAYLRYRNSGLDLPTWKERALGHLLELHVRGLFAFWRGPIDGIWYFREGVDEQLQPVDLYAAQAVRTRSLPTLGGELAFGVAPFLNVGGAIGWAPGRLVVDTAVVSEGVETGGDDTTSVYPPVLWFGPRVEAVFFPAGVVHPAVGAGATMLQTPRVDDLIVMPNDQVQAFPASLLVYGVAWPGVQARLGNGVDAWLRVPVEVLLAGDAFVEARDASRQVLTPDPPAADASVGLRLEVGLQVRLGGAKVRAPREEEP